MLAALSELTMSRDPMFAALDRMLGFGNPSEIERGFVFGGFSLHNRFAIRIGFKHEYPEFGDGEDDLDCYGVCDTPAQFIERHKAMLAGDERTFIVSFAHIKKDTANAGKGGGWRWHKWGPYSGDGSPECEYLDDEDGFSDGVHVYHIYDVSAIVKCGAAT